MFMANDLICPQEVPCTFEFIHLDFPGYLEKAMEEAKRSGTTQYANETEMAAWDNWYLEETQSLKWVTSNPKFLVPDFKHGAMHDAESVFFLCILFFNRLWPYNEKVKASEASKMERGRGKVSEILARKIVGDGDTRAFPQARRLPTDGFQAGPKFDAFHKMLNDIHFYLLIPWFAVKGTGRGERYEFHLHDFMQEVLLKEIQKLRDAGDPLHLKENPISVQVSSQSSGYVPAASDFCGLFATVRTLSWKSGRLSSNLYFVEFPTVLG